MEKRPQSNNHSDLTPPSQWVERFLPLVPKGGEILDVACGGGRHTRLFRRHGHPVLALDRDTNGLADLAGDPGLETLEVDLEAGQPWPLQGRRFAAAVVTDYLYRPLLPAIVASVGHVLIYETFAAGNERYGRPRNPDFLLQPGELLDAVAGRLEVVAYEHGTVLRPRRAVVQRICANAGEGEVFLPSSHGD